MKKIAALCAGLLLLTGCGPSYDEAGYDLVIEWADEVVPVTEMAALTAPDGVHEEDADQIEATNSEYWDRDDWPDRSEIETWMFTITQAGQTLTVDGEEFARAVHQLEDASSWLAIDIRDGDEQEIQWSAEDAYDAVQDFRELITP
ncbi:MAG: hypothetical protein HLX51_11685 [Micrococcaceae bacterium]|nr:hypothetical protein [Micrococcaceae bacterium]